jgi:hypothetical protein
MSLKSFLLVLVPALAAAQRSALPDDISDDDVLAYRVGGNDDATDDRFADDEAVVKLAVLQRIYGKVVDGVQRQFFGIPYAKARRFEAPRKLTVWERMGTKNATIFGFSCSAQNTGSMCFFSFQSLFLRANCKS